MSQTDEGPIRERTDGVSLQVRVIPRAQRSEIVGVQEGNLVVRLAAPPVDGKANAALVEVLCQQWGLKKSSVRLLSGDKSRIKILVISGLARSDVTRLLDRKE